MTMDSPLDSAGTVSDITVHSASPPTLLYEDRSPLLSTNAIGLQDTDSRAQYGLVSFLRLLAHPADIDRLISEPRLHFLTTTPTPKDVTLSHHKCDLDREGYISVYCPGGLREANKPFSYAVHIAISLEIPIFPFFRLLPLSMGLYPLSDDKLTALLASHTYGERLTTAQFCTGHRFIDNIYLGGYRRETTATGEIYLHDVGWKDGHLVYPLSG